MRRAGSAPRVSVLLPTHNRADVVGLAVQSVLDQSEADFELLVVADGCIDGTVAAIEAIRDARIRVFDLPKAPYYGYANRNVALREARGEFVAFAAHDDLLFPDHLRRLVDRLEQTGAEWVYSRPLWVSTDGVIVPYATNLLMADELECFVREGNTIPASCVLYRRACLDRYGYWPEDVPSAGDWRHWIAIIEGGGRQRLTSLDVSTCLHFSAVWKQSRHSAVPEVQTWLEIVDGCAWWPDALRVHVPTGMTEQAAVADVMRRDPEAWMEAVRTATRAVLDRVAWDHLRGGRAELQRRREDEARLRQRVDVLEREAEAAQQGCQDLTARLAHVDACLEEAGRITGALTEQVAGLEASLATERDAHAANRDQLGATLASRSWRLTAPLRALRRLFVPPA